MSSIRFGRQVCGNLTAAASREWLVTDGLGGYAMGTVAGLRTRRYHALLVVAGDHPGARRVGLVALDPVVVIGDRRIRLGTDEWSGATVDPVGHVDLASFDLDDGIPRWRWSVDGVVIERELAMQHGCSRVAITHRIVSAPGEVRVEVTPLCTWRDAHHDRFAWGAPDVSSDQEGFVFEDAYRVMGPGWKPDGAWYRGAYLREEAARGLGSTEDLWAAGHFSAELQTGESLDIVASAMPCSGSGPSAETVVMTARTRARGLVAKAGVSTSVDAALVVAADQFIVSTSTGPSVVAGYPWFGEWSRDAMTAYEGLFLDTNRAAEGRALLLRSAATLSEGMLANTADGDGPVYNTADATMWFIHAVGRHVVRTGDDDLARELAGALDEIVEHHVAGTRFNIGVDPDDGLLRQGAEGWALTWMDARVDGRAITPRIGKAVEVNALWINALGTIAALNARTGRPYRWAALQARARSSFVSRFTRADGLGLHDVVDGPSGTAAAVRPNQLFALSLPYGPGGPSSIVDVCRAELLTSLGLRSLAPSDPLYVGHHRGDVQARDAAYHQGTVWAWLLGAYVDACTAVGVTSAGVIDGLAIHLGDWGLGSVSETADGDAPHNATGCPFQAWSVAEALRLRRRVENP